MIIGIFLFSLIGTILIGVPIAFALLLSGVAMMLYLNGFDTQILSQNLFSGTDSYAMMAIPFFVLAGEVMNRGGITVRIVNSAMSLIGHIKGGLGYVAIGATLLFASMIGSAVASTAALGAILVPMMVQVGHDRDDATALVAASNLTSPIMPPSVSMIIFGVVAGVSITDLFMAGIAPAMYISIALGITWFFVSKGDSATVLPKASTKERLKAIKDGFWALLLPVLLLVGLRGGYFTPTEGGVVAVVYALIIGLFVYKDLKVNEIMECLIDAAKSSSVIMFLAAAAMVSSWLMTVGNIPMLVTEILNPFIDRPLLLMLVIFGIVILVGTSMDVTPTIMILTPVLMPAVKAAGIDPVYFGLIFCVNAFLGLLTPPVGTVLNVAVKAGQTTMERLVKSIIPFFIAIAIVLVLMILWPDLVMVPARFFSGK